MRELDIGIRPAIFSSQRGDSRGDGARHRIRSEDISHSYLFNVLEKICGDGRSGFRCNTSPFTSNNSGDLGRSSGFYSYGNDRNGHSSHTRQVSSYNHGGLNIDHQSFPQEDIPRDMKG